MDSFRKLNKRQRAQYFADYCADIRHFRCTGGRLIFDWKVQEMVCIMQGLKSRKTRAVKKANKKFWFKALSEGK